MANHNGRTTQRDENIEHGYQDWRDQRDRANGRDDFRGLDRDRFADRLSSAAGTSEGRDPWAERDRNLYGDRAEGNARGSGGSLERVSGYGYDDGNPSRERTSYRGQSGAQAGGTQGNQNSNGGSRGQWGDMDQGGRSSVLRGPHAGKGPKGFQRSDERIKELVHEALTDHEHLDATHIVVDVKDGEVSLTGTVEDRRTKRLAEDVVEGVKGVKDVQNQLRLQKTS